MGQYVENESLMYEPCVRNRRVAPEKVDILSNDRYSFLTIEKRRGKKRKKGRKSKRKATEVKMIFFLYYKIYVFCLIIEIQLLIVDIAWLLRGCNGSDKFFDDPATPQNFSTLDFFSFIRWLSFKVSREFDSIPWNCFYCFFLYHEFILSPW